MSLFVAQSEPEIAKVVLERELSRRLSRNPRYSLLRSFAKSLGVSHSLLSLILSGKRPASRNVWRKMRDRSLINQLEVTARDTTEGNASEEFTAISLDTFALLSNWQHYAVLSLLETSDSKLDTRWIGRRLGISAADARLVVSRLKRLKLISFRKGKWKQSTKPLKVENNISTAATREHHKQLLRKAEESLEEDEFGVRDFSATTFAMDPKLVPYARERIRKFRRELVRELEGSGSPAEVYQLAVQLYPVSKKS